MIKKLFLLLFVTFSCYSLSAQTRLYIEDRSTDYVGGKLLTTLKDSIQADPDFQLLSGKDKEHYYLFLKFVSADRHKDEGEKEGYGSIYLVLWFIEGPGSKPYYIDYKFGYASEENVGNISGEILTKTRAAISLIMKMLNTETEEEEN